MTKKAQFWWASGMLVFGALLLLEGFGVIAPGKASFRGFRMESFQSFISGGLFIVGGAAVLLNCWREHKRGKPHDQDASKRTTDSK